jgi:predicted nucleotidyltransferase
LSGKYLIFAARNKKQRMSRTDYIDILQGYSSTLREDYGIKSLRLFGSVARGEEHEGSDVDVFVETETPNPFLLMDAKEYIERLVGRSVDIVRNHKNLNPRLRSRIERDGVAVF